ncbi:MAG: hypothetical protein NZ561_01135 [Phycisphaerae bacterium]|nr:hypothetical protein [Phycisphaerae bacterium]
MNHQLGSTDAGFDAAVGTGGGAEGTFGHPPKYTLSTDPSAAGPVRPMTPAVVVTLPGFGHHFLLPE